MNWLKLIIFICFVLYFYHLMGALMQEKLNLKHSSSVAKIIYGYLTLTAIQWLIGFPAQVLHISWNYYYYIMLLIYVTLFIYLYRLYGRTQFNRVLINNNILCFVKNYWFLLLLVLSFSFWSMSSQLPYLQMNYDDHYYLGAIIQQIGSNALSTVNYFNGTPMDVGFTRLINTYEINYGFWSTLFRMDAAFFARAVMVVHNYILIFIGTIAFADSFQLLKKSNTQFILIPFIIFIIPAGYLSNEFSINLYDGWQMNTAIWYGGSIVRMLALPICCMIIKEIINDFKFRKIVLFIIASIAFVSYSSVFVPIAFISLMMGYFYLLWKLYEISKTRKRLVFVLLAVCGSLIVMKLGPRVLELIIPGLTNAYGNASGNVGRQIDVFTNSNYLFVMLSLGTITFYHKREGGEYFKISMILCLAAILLYSGIFIKFFLTICMGYDFVAYRMVTSIQMMMLILMSMMIIYYLTILLSYYWISSIALVSVIACQTFNMTHLDKYISQNNTKLSSGSSIYGFAPDRLFKNQNMVPNLIVDFQRYFQTQDANRHRIISPHLIPYEDGALFLSPALSMLGNNVESCVSYESVRCDNIDFGEIQVMLEFVEGNREYEDVQNILEKYRIEYIITVNPAVKNKLINRGMSLVDESYSLTNDCIYLVKLF